MISDIERMLRDASEKLKMTHADDVSAGLNNQMTAIYRNFDKKMLEREYSPSSCVDDYMVHVDEYVSASEAARRLASAVDLARYDVAYGPLDSQRLDLFLPKPVAAPAPVQCFMHGGYWQELSKSYSSFAAPLFQYHGCAFAAFGYSLAPSRRLSDIVEECRTALAWLHRNAEWLNIDKERIFLSGSSAGAHLAMMLYTTDWEKRGLPGDIVKGVCAVSGIYDLEPIRLTYVNDKLSMDEEEAALNSPLSRRPSALTPVISAWGDNETGEFKRQSLALAEKLERDGAPLECMEIAGRNHFDVIMDLADGDSWLGRSILSQMGVLSARCQRTRGRES